MSIPNRLKKLFYYRMHPEAAIRYGPIVKLVKKNKWQKDKILEIGSGSYGITPYLKKPITGVDTNFDEPEYPLLKQVKATGAKLPFADNSFDIAILSDVLEHIPKEKRKTMLQEALRVSRKAVIISGPFGKESFKQDQRLAKLSVIKTGTMHPFFKDHLEFGLPEVNDIRVYLKGQRKIQEIVTVGHFFNLKSREKLMNSFITKSKLGYFFYLKGLMPLVPIMKRQNKPPCYRTVILVRLNNESRI